MKIPHNFQINRLKPMTPRTALLCPACNNEIGLTELIERRGYIGCINCVG